MEAVLSGTITRKLRLPRRCLLAVVANIFLLISQITHADFFAVQWGYQADLLRISERTGQIIERVPTVASFGLNSLARHPSGDVHTIFTRGFVGSKGIAQIDSQTGDYSLLLPIRGIDARGMAYSVTGELYAIVNGAESNLFSRIDTVTGDVTVFGEVGNVQSLAFSEEGTLYAYELNSGLGIIDVATGELTDVNPNISSSLDPPSIQTLEFGSDGQLYGAGDGLYRIDVETGALQFVGGGDYDIRGMVRVVPEPSVCSTLIICLLGCVICNSSTQRKATSR